MSALEDTYLDVIDKAKAGLGMSDSELCRSAGISQSEWQDLRGGELKPEVLGRIAHPLQLDADAVIRIAHDEYEPDGGEVEGLKMFTTRFAMPGYPDGSVNAYVVWDPVSKEAVVFDTGTDVSGVLGFIKEKGLNVAMICLTHTHPDHVEKLGELQDALDNPPTHVHSSERDLGMLSIDDGAQMHLGGLVIQTRLTSGHSPGGMTYVIDGLQKPVAIVGDAIYAGSVGGARNNWETALERVESQILSLPPETILCPGHGPMTTVGYERQHNPLFPGQR